MLIMMELWWPPCVNWQRDGSASKWLTFNVIFKSVGALDPKLSGAS